MEFFCSINCSYYNVLSECCNFLCGCVRLTVNKEITKKHSITFISITANTPYVYDNI